MTDAKLKQLFEEALAGEPHRVASADDDIARGRALRSRRRRTRIGGGVAVLAVVGVGALVAPLLVPDGDGVPAASDQVWPYDTPAEVPGQHGSDDFFADEQAESSTALSAPGADAAAGLVRPQSATLAQAGSYGSVIEERLWAAVAPALPEDVLIQQTRGLVLGGLTTGHGLEFVAVRDNTTFRVEVRLQESRPDLPEFQPCREPAEIPDGVATWTPCAQGYDDEDRWRIVGRAGDATGVAVAEGGSVAAMVRWTSTVHDTGTTTGTVGDFTETFTFEEGNALVEAAWTIGARYDDTELTTGWDMEAARDTWPRIKSAVEYELRVGPLGQTELDVSNPSTIAASFHTADDVEVELVIWQDDRFYENLCTAEVSGACESWPGSATLFEELDDTDAVLSGSGVAGLGSYFVRVTGASVDTDRDVGAALMDVIPQRAATVTPGWNTD